MDAFKNSFNGPTVGASLGAMDKSIEDLGGYIFDPDTTLPRGTTQAWTPDERLRYEVLCQGLRDASCPLSLGHVGKSASKQSTMIGARAWIVGAYEGVLSCEDCCHTLGLDYDAVRDACVRKWALEDASYAVSGVRRRVRSLRFAARLRASVRGKIVGKGQRP